MEAKTKLEKIEAEIFTPTHNMQKVWIKKEERWAVVKFLHLFRKKKCQPDEDFFITTKRRGT